MHLTVKAVKVIPVVIAACCQVFFDNVFLSGRGPQRAEKLQRLIAVFARCC